MSFIPSVGIPLFFGALDLVAAVVTALYLGPGIIPVATPVALGVRSPITGTLRNLRLRQNTLTVAGVTTTYTVRVNGVASGVLVALDSAVAEGANLANTVAILAGDRIDIEITKSGVLVSGLLDVSASLLIVPS